MNAEAPALREGAQSLSLVISASGTGPRVCKVSVVYGSVYVGCTHAGNPPWLIYSTAYGH